MFKPKLNRQMLHLLLIVAVVATTALVVLPAPAGAANVAVVDELVWQAAAAAPTGKVRVIVHGNDVGQVTSAAAKNGGRAIRTLDIVNGVAVEVPASAVKSLSRELGVKRVAFDPPVVSRTQREAEVGASTLATVYPWALAAVPLWQKSKDSGAAVGIGVIDTGVASTADFQGPGGSRIVASAHFGAHGDSSNDPFGHGTAVAGVIAGSSKDGKYVGINPNANIVSLKVGDNSGVAYASDVVAAIRWAVSHKKDYNLRVLNLSLTSSVAESYKTSLLSLAVEYAWFNGMVVVVAAGNTGPGGVLHPPANDPYVITVGATDDKGTREVSDDSLASFSSYGATQDGVAKPDVVAPGRHIVTVLSRPDSNLAKLAPDHVIGNSYIRLSGTSLSAGEISGIVAQILQSNPSYRPDQIKWLIKDTARTLKGTRNDTIAGTGAGYPDGQRAASYGGPTQLANRGLVPNKYIAGAVAKALFNGVSWDGVSWDGVSWDGVSWDGVSWDGVSWDGVSWDGVSWDGVSWDGVSWDGVSWDGVSWDVLLQ